MCGLTFLKRQSVGQRERPGLTQKRRDTCDTIKWLTLNSSRSRVMGRSLATEPSLHLTPTPAWKEPPHRQKTRGTKGHLPCDIPGGFHGRKVPSLSFARIATSSKSICRAHEAHTADHNTTLGDVK